MLKKRLATVLTPQLNLLLLIRLPDFQAALRRACPDVRMAWRGAEALSAALALPGHGCLVPPVPARLRAVQRVTSLSLAAQGRKDVAASGAPHVDAIGAVVAPQFVRTLLRARLLIRV